MVLLRRVLGSELRAQRLLQGRTLREVSSDARVSLGYLSEVERGHKESSSELLSSICTALDVPLSTEAIEKPLVMVQPDPYACGVMLDLYERHYGVGKVRKS